MLVYVVKKKNKPPKTLNIAQNQNLMIWAFTQTLFLQEHLESSRNELVFFSYFSRQASKITRKEKLVYSYMIRGSTNINWVCKKRLSGRIDAVYDKHSVFDVD